MGDTIVIKTAGYSTDEKLTVSVGVSSCGNIRDGVTFWHDNQGCWVVAYKDLMRIAKAATQARRPRQRAVKP